MARVQMRLAGCALLTTLAGCLIDRGSLDHAGDEPDARTMDEDAGTPHDAATLDDDARARDEDASARDEDARARDDAAGTTAACGDGALDAGEGCDDGNASVGDGCDPSCVVERGFRCSGAPSTCATTCGDGDTAGREECDDGRVDDGDGCDATCLFETSRRVSRGPGLALAVADDAYDGSLGSMSCVDIDVRPFPLDRLTNLEVELAVRHPWVADLVIKLVGPGGAPVVTLMSRPSIDEAADDGTGRSGNDANLSPDFPIRFADDAAVSAEDVGDGVGNRNVCERDGICDFAPNAGAATPGNLSRFEAGPASGTWRLCVGDGAGADVGEIDSVTLAMELGP